MEYGPPGLQPSVRKARSVRSDNRSLLARRNNSVTSVESKAHVCAHALGLYVRWSDQRSSRQHSEMITSADDVLTQDAQCSALLRKIQQAKCRSHSKVALQSLPFERVLPTLEADFGRERHADPHRPEARVELDSRHDPDAARGVFVSRTKHWSRWFAGQRRDGCRRRLGGDGQHARRSARVGRNHHRQRR